MLTAKRAEGTPDRREGGFRALALVLTTLIIITSFGCDTRASRVRLEAVVGPAGGEIHTISVVRDESSDQVIAASSFGVHVTTDDGWRLQPGLGLGAVPADTPVRGLRRDGAQINYPRSHLFLSHDDAIWNITRVDQKPRLLWSDSNGARWREVALPFEDRVVGEAPATSVTRPAEAAEPPRLTSSGEDLFLVGTSDVWKLTGTPEDPKWTSIGLAGLPVIAEGFPPAIRNYLPAAQGRPFELVTLLTDQLLVYRRAAKEDPWVMTSSLAIVDRELLGITGAETVFLVASDSIQRTDEQGERWFRFWPEDLPRIEAAFVLRRSDTQPGYVLLIGGTDGSIWKSVDGGTTWKQTRPADVDERAVSGFAVSSDHRTVWASTLGAGVLRSDDGGETWATENAGLRAVRPLDLAFSGDGDLLTASRAGLHQLAGEPEAGNWAPLHNRATTAVYFDTRNQQTLSGTMTGALITPDDGDGTEPTQAPFGERRAFEFLPQALDRSLVPEQAIVSIGRSVEGDGWLAWSRLHGAVQAPQADGRWEKFELTDALVSALSAATVTQFIATSDGTIFLLEENSNSRSPALLWRSKDSGESWTTVHAFSREDGSRVHLRAVEIDGGSTLFTAQGDQFTRSVDNGETWVEIAGPWEGRRIIDFATRDDRAVLLVDARRNLEIIALDGIDALAPLVSRHAIQFPNKVAPPAYTDVTRFDLFADRVTLTANGHIWIGKIPERRTAIPSGMAMLATLTGALVLIAIAFLYARSVLLR